MNKTQPTKQSVKDFIEAIEDESKKKDCLYLLHFFEEISQSSPVLWGDSLVGFGSYHYTYASGREGDWFLVGFSPRKAGISLYVYQDTEKNKNLVTSLGKYKIGKSCITIKRLQDIDLSILQEISFESIKFLKNSWK